MPLKTIKRGEVDSTEETRLVAVRDRRTGQLRILSAAHVMTGGVAERASEDIDLAFLVALGRGGRS
jgi:hypothetical protein